MIGPCAERAALSVRHRPGGRRRRVYAHARWVAGSGRKGTALRGGPLRVRGGWLRAVVGGAGSACGAVRLPTPLPPSRPGETGSLGSPFIFPGVCAAHLLCPSLHPDVRCYSVLTCPGIQEGSSRILCFCRI